MVSKFTGKEYLMLDIAGLYGLDKETWEKRLEWFYKHENELEDLSSSADEPNCYMAAVNAWRDVQAGKPIGYAINLDATASGCQILALLTGDKQSAARVNLINTGAREDLYTYIYNKIKEVAPISASITRDVVKKAIMTSLYGSKKKPVEVFGKAYYDIFEQVMNQELPGVWHLNKWLLDNWDSRKTVYSWLMPDNFHVDSVVYNNVKYSCKCMGQDIEFYKEVEGCTEHGRFLSANIAHSVDGFINREITIRAQFTQEYKDYLKKLLNLNAIFSNSDDIYYKQSKDCKKMFKTLWKRYEECGFLSARILQYVNKETIKTVGVKGIEALRELVDSLPEKTFEVFSIHDCFHVLPNYGNELRKLYREICSGIAKSNMLVDILSHAFEDEVLFTKLSDDLDKLVLESEYAVC